VKTANQWIFDEVVGAFLFMHPVVLGLQWYSSEVAKFMVRFCGWLFVVHDDSR